MAQPAPPAIDRVLYALDTLDAHLAAVGIDEWETNPNATAGTLKRVHDIGIYLAQVADTVCARQQARRGVELLERSG